MDFSTKNSLGTSEFKGKIKNGIPKYDSIIINLTK